MMYVIPFVYACCIVYRMPLVYYYRIFANMYFPINSFFHSMFTSTLTTYDQSIDYEFSKTVTEEEFNMLIYGKLNHYTH